MVLDVEIEMTPGTEYRQVLGPAIGQVALIARRPIFAHHSQVRAGQHFVERLPEAVGSLLAVRDIAPLAAPPGCLLALPGNLRPVVRVALLAHSYPPPPPCVSYSTRSSP